jgi:hypothetical protein
MQIKVQLVVCDDNGHEDTHTDVVVLDKACQRLEHLGLTLAESKQLLTTLQQHVLEQQATAFVQSRTRCPILLQTRVKTLNHELGAVFRRWCLDFPVAEEESQAAQSQICRLSSIGLNIA